MRLVPQIVAFKEVWRWRWNVLESDKNVAVPNGDDFDRAGTEVSRKNLKRKNTMAIIMVPDVTGYRWE